MVDYRPTVTVPKTPLPTKARIADEPRQVEAWAGLHDRLAAKNEGRPTYLLHDGPPYANGNIHMGHALNKVLKDVICRGQRALGFDARLHAGWDCRGLPIEWKVEEDWRKQKRDKNAEPEAFRQDCRDYAARWVDVQKEQFKRLGIVADWESAPYGHGYRTMSPEMSSLIVYRFHRMVERGDVYSAKKPVLWSHVERTAMAEAETVDREHQVEQAWVTFRMFAGPLKGDDLLVWTTTPWSLPSNVAVAYNPDIAYGLYEQRGRRFVVADSCVERALQNDYQRLRDIDPKTDFPRHAEHPLNDLGYPVGEDCVSRIMPASFVRDSAGTGLVHVAPSHSRDDWEAWKALDHTLTFPTTINEDGRYHDSLPLFGGTAVVKGKRLGPANEMVLDAMAERGTLYRRETAPLTLQHSWRSDAVLLTLATDQWFIRVTGEGGVVERVLAGLAEVEFSPSSGGTRMASMLRDRPDWLVSRQRLWGTPMAILAHRRTGEPCRDPAVLGAIHQELMDRGADAWWSEFSVEDMFAAIGRPDEAKDWRRVDDVLDVWFDSACVHAITGERADLVVEGSDQSRGWFQSSALEGMANDGVLPYREVLTHGFVLDGSGRKMSKSEGNVIDPMTVVDRLGADAVRVWVAATDVREDLRVSDAVLATHAETVRKVRITLRYLVAALAGVTVTHDRVIVDPLNRYVLNRVAHTSDALFAMLAEKDFTRYVATIANFCANDLSALLFDARKDILYCDGPSARRDDYLATLSEVFEHLVRWAAPVMVFAAEEMWQALHPESSVHEQDWLHPHWLWNDERLMERWAKVLDYRSEMLGKIEEVRAAGAVKSSLECHLTVFADPAARQHMLGIDMAELTLTAGVDIRSLEGRFTAPTNTVVERVTTPRCDRCWRHVEVEAVEDSHLCDRCAEVVA
jgi:isoleucyl-tRNA synthetase